MGSPDVLLPLRLLAALISRAPGAAFAQRRSHHHREPGKTRRAGPRLGRRRPAPPRIRSAHRPGDPADAGQPDRQRPQARATWLLHLPVANEGPGIPTAGQALHETVSLLVGLIRSLSPERLGEAPRPYRSSGDDQEQEQEHEQEQESPLRPSTLNPRLLIVEDEPATRPVDKHLASLRAKLEPDPAQPRRLKPVHGAGSRLERSTSKSSCPNPQSL